MTRYDIFIFWVHTERKGDIENNQAGRVTREVTKNNEYKKIEIITIVAMQE